MKPLWENLGYYKSKFEFFTEEWKGLKYIETMHLCKLTSFRFAMGSFKLKSVGVDELL